MLSVVWDTAHATEGVSKEIFMFLSALQTFLNSCGHAMRMPPMLLVTCPGHPHRGSCK